MCISSPAYSAAINTITALRCSECGADFSKAKVTVMHAEYMERLTALELLDGKGTTLETMPASRILKAGALCPLCFCLRTSGRIGHGY